MIRPASILFSLRLPVTLVTLDRVDILCFIGPAGLDLPEAEERTGRAGVRRARWRAGCGVSRQPEVPVENGPRVPGGEMATRRLGVAMDGPRHPALPPHAAKDCRGVHASVSGQGRRLCYLLPRASASVAWLKPRREVR